MCAVSSAAQLWSNARAVQVNLVAPVRTCLNIGNSASERSGKVEGTFATINDYGTIGRSAVTVTRGTRIAGRP